MKKYIFILSLFILASLQAKTIPEDTLQLGKPGSVAEKTIKLGSDFKIHSSGEFEGSDGIRKKFGSGSGSGSGGINVLTNPNAEEALSGWTNVGGTLTVLSGSSVLEGSNSFSFDASTQEDRAKSSFVTLNDGLLGTSCEARVYYTGSDENLTAEVVDANGKVLGSQVLKSHTIAGYESVFFLCPSKADVQASALAGQLALQIRQTTATDAVAIVFDLTYLGSLIGLAEMVLPDTCSGRVTAAGVLVSPVHCIASVTKVTVGQYRLNLKPGEYSIAPSAICTVNYPADTGTDNNCMANGITTTSVGIFVRDTDNTGAAVDQDFSFTLTKQFPDAKQSVQVYKSIPKIADNVNVFSFSMAVDGAVSGENVDFVNGNCTGTTAVSCPFKPGIFTSIPKCSVDLTYDSRTKGGVSPALNGISWSVSPSASPANVICVRGDDYKMPTVQPILINQVSSTIESGVTRASCTILNSGTPTMDMTDDQCASWVSSVSDVGVGQTTITIKSSLSYFANCQLAALWDSAIVAFNNNDRFGPGDASATVVTRKNADNVIFDAPFTISCDFKR